MKKNNSNFVLMLVLISLAATIIIESACCVFGSVAVFAFAMGTVLVAGVTLACIQIINFNKTQKP